MLTLAQIHWRLYKENGEALKKTTDKNAAYPYGEMNFHSPIGNLFPNSQ
jgi:hypothetical protein